MGFNDKIIKWWIQNMYSPKIFDYAPGYIIVSFENQFGKAFQRLITLPEDIIENIETKFYNQYGEKARTLLFEAGRVYGMSFAYTAGAPVYDGSNLEKLSKYLQFSIKYGFYSWAQELGIEEFTLTSDTLRLVGKYHNHVVCRHNGDGILLTESIPLGVLEYVLRKSVVLSSSKCEGRNDDSCETIYVFGGNHDLSKQIFEGKSFEKYKKYNSIQKVTYAENSWSDLLKNKIIKVADVGFEIRDNIVFTFEPSFMHQLEIMLSELKGGSDLLFDICFEWGKKFSKKQNNNFIAEMLAIFGYGDVIIRSQSSGYKVHMIQHPWTPNEEENQEYAMLRGIISGMLSEVNQKEIKLSKVEKSYEKDKFSVTFI